MEQVPDNYCDWEWHVVSPSTADDGFGNHVWTDLDMFWYNSDAREIDRYGGLH